MDIIAKIFPGWALSRQVARVRLVNAQRLYEAGQVDKLRPSLRGPGLSPDTVIDRARSRIRDTARDLDENYDLAIGVLDVLVDNVIGSGLQYEPMMRLRNGDLAPVNDEIAKAWGEFWRAPEITGEYPGETAERLMCRSWLRDGEVLIVHRPGHEGGYVFQMLEADHLPWSLFQPDSNVVHGVEKDANGRPVGYHLYKTHPGSQGLSVTGLDTVRVNADLVTHLKFTRRIGQTRGVSVLHGVVRRLEDMKATDEAELTAAKVAASLCAVIERTPDFIGVDTSKVSEIGDRAFEFRPGMVFDNLLPGESVNTIGHDRPNAKIIDFLKSGMRAVASGVGASYSSISKDYSGTYSAQRQEMQESQPAYERIRRYFIEKGPREIYTRWLRMAVMSGQVSIPTRVNRETMFDVDIRRGGGMPWIDPLKEVQADIAMREAGFESRTGIIRRRGGDPRKIDAEIDADTFTPDATAEQPADDVDPVDDQGQESQA